MLTQNDLLYMSGVHIRVKFGKFYSLKYLLTPILKLLFAVLHPPSLFPSSLFLMRFPLFII